MENCEDQIVEFSPGNQRYTRCKGVLGRGAFKIVYKGFDVIDGIEIAWNQVSIEDALQSPQHMEKLYSEVHLLKTLKHENIIKSYMSWVDHEKKAINLITELFTSGSLREYRLKHRTVDMKAIKNWARQILCGLRYFHSHNPPIIHRDLKCDNIFINGNHGEVKIGDLGLATMMLQPTARSVIGTPEFMAPELYDEEYNELVDIYSFGMCMLELMTCEYPYAECRNSAQIFKKVTSGVKPAALAKVIDPSIKQFIEKCLVPASQRLSAAELLNDPFLLSETSKDMTPVSLHISDVIPRSSLLISEHSSMEVDSQQRNIACGDSTESMNSSAHFPSYEIQRQTNKKKFRFSGERLNNDSISLTLLISDSCGKVNNINFVFYLDKDTTLSIAGEMTEHLDLPNDDMPVIYEMINDIVMKLAPSSKASTGTPGSANSLYEDSLTNSMDAFSTSSIGKHESNGICSVIVGESPMVSSFFAVSHGSDESVELSFSKYATPALDIVRSPITEANTIGEYSKDISRYESACSDGDAYFTASNDIWSCISSLSLMDEFNEEEICDEMKLELVAIDMQYQQCCRDLIRMRHEAVENLKRKWIAKQKSPSGSFM